MGSITCLILAGFLMTTTAFAKSEVVSRISHSNQKYKIDADLYYDAELKKADLWVSFYQGPESDKVEYKASSLDERLSGTQIRLVPVPAVHERDTVLQTFDGYETASGKYNKNRGFAIYVHQPVAALRQETLLFLMKNFPKSIAYDQRKRPAYIKCLLSRLTSYQAYPIAAFDFEPALASQE